ncbi:hypothetical protein WMF37_25305 [Sorangium sp. So ce291]|uniref:hypothetical protein n=1 Tax=Sorangium sp. So ce291 TaxID=3133294 RepID=UPI003F61E48F
MGELGAGEQALLDALRDEDEPTDDDRRRMRAAVWARLGIAGATAAAVATGAESTAAAGTAGAGATGASTAGAGATGASTAGAGAIGPAGAGAAVEMAAPAAAGVAAKVSTAAAKGAGVTLLGAPLKIGLATLVVGLATGAALYFPARDDAPGAPEAARIAAPASRSSQAAALADGTPVPAGGSAPAGASAPADETPAPAGASAPAGGSAPAGVTAPAEASAAPPAADGAARKPTPRTPTAAAAGKPGPEGLDAEIALLRDAQQALQAGQFAQALSKLDEHASRFPRGVLSTEREASRAIALCRSGRAAPGKAIAAKLLAQNPGSPLATRVRAACGQEE